MEKKFVLALLVLTCMVGIFTGCEQEPTLVQRVGSIQAYNEELVDLILQQVVGRAHGSYAENESILLDSGITCAVVESDSEDTTLQITLSDWIADDGTEISGFTIVDVMYYDNGNISSIKMVQAALYFDRTSIGYLAEIFDGDDSTPAFTYDSEMFMCVSLIVDGKTLISNMFMYT